LNFINLENFIKMGRYIQRSFILLTILYIPLGIFLFFVEYYLLLFKIDPVISKLTGDYTRILSISLLPWIYYRIFDKVLSCQSITIPSVIVAIITNLLNILLNFILVQGRFIPWEWKGLHFLGSPIATTISRFIMFFLIALFSYVNKYIDVFWLGFDFKKLLNFRKYFSLIKIGIYGAFQFCLEAWGFNFTTIISSFMGDEVIGSNIIIINICIFSFMIPNGLSIATSILIGQSLGAKDKNTAKKVSILSILFVLIIMSFIGAICFIFKKNIAYIYTNDSEIIKSIERAIPFVISYQIVDGIISVLNGQLIGLGKQLIGAICNFLAYYVFGLPFGALLAIYFKWSTSGIWFGLTLGIYIISSFLIFYILLIDWDSQIELALNRIK
jgi:multidrug resistance protein, MATE family